MNMNQSLTAKFILSQPGADPYRPVSVIELRARTLRLYGIYDAKQDLNHNLGVGEGSRRRAKILHDAGDLEGAYMEYARVAIQELFQNTTT
jgi:hypothetical protein